MTDTPMHEAGFDSFLTAKVLIRLSARVEGEVQAELSPASDDEAYQTAPEDGGVSLIGQNDIFPPGRSTRTTSPQNLEAGSSALSHNNPYDLLSNLNLEDDQQEQLASPDPVFPTMMPHNRSSFWARYGNKLRVNGTVEEVCVIR